MLGGTLLASLFYLSVARRVDEGFYLTARTLAAGTGESQAVILRNYVLVNGVFAQFHERPYFLATDDASFDALVTMIRSILNKGFHPSGNIVFLANIRRGWRKKA
ncbi:MAG: hypothetical protein HC894_16320, partial [Microcoleus sp. SM1_3_4]|nr:hypothetical protein [Microcoleus sp. SM1_3_4]